MDFFLDTIMQLSLHSDYACRVLIYLALNKNQKSSIEEIATAFAISKNHLVKIVHQLGKLGFINTLRGRGGGISLAHDPADIKMGMVVRQTEPNFSIVECFNPDSNSCPIAGPCGLQPWLAKALEAFLAELDEVSLSDVIAKQKPLRQALNIKT